MKGGYYIDLEAFKLMDYAKVLRDSELVPSRRILQEKTLERFRALKSKGMANLDGVLISLKTGEQIKKIAADTKIPEDFLTILVREIKSLHPKPVKLMEIPGISKAATKALTKQKIKTTRDLFDHVRTKQARQVLSEATGIPLPEIIELTRLTDVARIKWVGANFARVLVDSSSNTTKKVTRANPETLLSEINRINDEKKYYKGKLGLKDIETCVAAAALVPEAIKY